MPARDLVLDTHIVIWLAIDPDRISAKTLKAIEVAGHRFVSHVTALEIQLKHKRNPKAFEFTLEFYEEAMKILSLEELPLTYHDIKALGSMKFLHRDPLDQLLMTQAAVRSLCLVTQDPNILRTAKRFKTFVTMS